MSTAKRLFIISEGGKVKTYELRETECDTEENVFLNGCPICIFNGSITDEVVASLININGDGEGDLVENLFNRLRQYDVSYCKMILLGGYLSFLKSHLKSQRERLNALKAMFHSPLGREDK